MLKITRNNKKGFILIEAIVVIVVISIALITLFTSYNKILNKIKEENKYDLSEELYKVKYIKSFVENNCSVEVYNLGEYINEVGPPNYLETECSFNDKKLKLNNFFYSFGIKKIYFLEKINEQYTYENLKYFDAYMIDYIKQLDVDDSESLIVVEFERESKDSNYNPINIYGTNTSLKETYIASLEW